MDSIDVVQDRDKWWLCEHRNKAQGTIEFGKFLDFYEELLAFQAVHISMDLVS